MSYTTKFCYTKYNRQKKLDGAKVTNYKGNFGGKKLFKAGLDPIQQFVGSYTVDIYYRRKGDYEYLEFNIRNTTSATSFFIMLCLHMIQEVR